MILEWKRGRKTEVERTKATPKLYRCSREWLFVRLDNRGRVAKALEQTATKTNFLTLR